MFDSTPNHTFEDEDEDEDEDDDEDDWRLGRRHADPIKIPAKNTKTPPRTTWKMAASNGVSMK